LAVACRLCASLREEVPGKKLALMKEEGAVDGQLVMDLMSLWMMRKKGEGTYPSSLQGLGTHSSRKKPPTLEDLHPLDPLG